MQISYHSFLTKIQKLQNFKKKKKTHFSIPAGTPGIGQYCPKLAGMVGIFSGTKQGVERIGLLAGTVYSDRTGRYGTKLTTLISTTNFFFNLFYPLYSFLWIDSLENVLMKRKNVLKPKFHHFKKYVFTSWFLCFCYLLLLLFCVFNGKSTNVGYGSLTNEPQVAK